MFADKDFKKSETYIKTFESIEYLIYSQNYDADFTIVIILDGLNKRELNDPRIQAMFTRSIHRDKSIFKISQEYYELPKRTIGANGSINHIFKPHNSREVQNDYQDKASMEKTLGEFKLLKPTCWNERCQTLTLDMTKVK